MCSEPKTLIVFDTNKLRQTLEGEPSYGTFEFGSEFKQMASFIKSNGLTEFIDIAVPEIAIQELLQQKIESYERDCENLSAIKTRLSELMAAENVQIELPAATVDCRSHLVPKVDTFVNGNGVKVMELPDARLSDIFKEVMQRAIEKQPPFKQSNKSSDIGFKDVIIWESILNYSSLSNYEKLIFISGDGIFDVQCKDEFRARVNKDIFISASTGLAIVELTKLYEDAIEKNKYMEFANSDYFKDFLDDRISELDSFEQNGVMWGKTAIDSINYFESYTPPKESPDSAANDEPAVIISKAVVKLKHDQTEKSVNLLLYSYIIVNGKEMDIDDFGFEIENG
jgi:hypothetical protein